MWGGPRQPDNERYSVEDTAPAPQRACQPLASLKTGSRPPKPSKRLPCDLAVPLLGMNPREHILTRMKDVSECSWQPALFRIAQNGNKLKVYHYYNQQVLYSQESESEVAQSCPTLCDLMDCSPPGSPVGFSKPEYWSGLPFPSPRDLPEPGIEPRSPALQADTLLSEPPGKPLYSHNRILFNNEKEQTGGN